MAQRKPKPEAADPEKAAAPKKAAKPKAKKYWKGKFHVIGLGVVQGEVTAEAKKAFQASIDKSYKKGERPDVESYMMDHDPVAKALEERKARYKKKYG